MQKTIFPRVCLMLVLLISVTACQKSSGGSNPVPPASTTCVWESSTWENCTWG